MQGIHELERKVDLYWSTLVDEPVQPVSEFISCSRFQQIARYIKISDPTQEKDLSKSEWFTKIEPVASHFRKTAQEIYIPGSHISVDEQLLKFTGRLKHLTEISSKAAGTGYKIYTEAEDGYLIDLRWSSTATGVAELDQFTATAPLYEVNNHFSASERVVLTFASSLRKAHPKATFAIVIDNFFTTHKLLAELRHRYNISGYGTCKAGNLIPKEMHLLKACGSKELCHGERLNWPYEGVNICCFVDMKPLFLMSSVHDFADSLTDVSKSSVKRPGASLTHAKQHVLQPTNEGEQEPPKRYDLDFPQLIVNYNNHMGGSDICQQVWNYYTTAKHPHHRNWWPMLWAMLDGTIGNIVRICHLLDYRTSHRDIQKHISLVLMRRPAATLRSPYRPSEASQRLSARESGLGKEEGKHQWQKISELRTGRLAGKKRLECVNCKPPKRRRRPLAERPCNTLIPDEQSYNRRTQMACLECQVALCAMGDCWKQWHERLVLLDL